MSNSEWILDNTISGADPSLPAAGMGSKLSVRAGSRLSVRAGSSLSLAVPSEGGSRQASPAPSPAHSARSHHSHHSHRSHRSHKEPSSARSHVSTAR